MSPLRAPRTLAEPQHVDSGEAVLRFELLEDLEPASRSERQVDAALAALRAHDAKGGDMFVRACLLDSAADAVWRLIVQHEACDCCDHHGLVERFRIPPEVMARVGAAH